MHREVVLCEVCGDGEVDEPSLDYCHTCGRRVCGDCVEATDDENGLYFCTECNRKTLIGEAVGYLVSRGFTPDDYARVWAAHREKTSRES